MNSSRRLFSIALVMFVVAAVPAFASHSWGGYHWARTANPFTLKVANNTNNGWPTYFDTAASDWTSSTIMHLSTSIGTSSRKCSMVAGTVQVCNNTYGSNGWLGLASINISGLHITQGSAKMNDTYFNTSTYNNPNEKLHVMCQEVGHTFGLDHQDTSGASLNTCMDYYSNTGANATDPASTHPNAHDYDELVTIYTHLDSTTTLAASAIFPNAVSAVDGNDRSSWGRLVSSEGRSAIYELDFGGGNKTITFVTWADDSHGNSGN